MSTTVPYADIYTRPSGAGRISAQTGSHRPADLAALPFALMAALGVCLAVAMIAYPGFVAGAEVLIAKMFISLAGAMPAFRPIRGRRAD